jgi:hypothetical protein
VEDGSELLCIYGLLDRLAAAGIAPTLPEQAAGKLVVGGGGELFS